jgi:putative ABC transport system permease protein
MLSLWLGAYEQGLAYDGLALGTYLTLHVRNFAFLTVGGSFALGVAPLLCCSPRGCRFPWPC